MATDLEGGAADRATLPYRPCVGVVLAHPDGRVFLAERNDLPGAWQMPQGGIDEGEAPSAAALREVEEEIGVGPALVTEVAEHPDWLAYDLPDELVGKVWKGRWRGQTQRWFLMRFEGRDGDIDLATAHPEFSRWRWATVDEALADIVPFKRGIYENVLLHFGPFLGADLPGNELSLNG